MTYYVCDNPKCKWFGIQCPLAHGYRCRECQAIMTAMSDDSEPDDTAVPHGCEIRLLYHADLEQWSGTLVYADPETCLLVTHESKAATAEELLRELKGKVGK